MNETGSATVSSLYDQGGGEDERRQHDERQPTRRRDEARPRRHVRRRRTRARLPLRVRPSGRESGRAMLAVVLAMAVPAEHGDVGASFVSEPRVGAVVDREPVARSAAFASAARAEDPEPAPEPP